MPRFRVTTETAVTLTAASFDEAAQKANDAATGEKALPDDADSLVVKVTSVAVR